MTVDEKRVRDLETDAALIKRDVSQFGTLFAKMDLTIEKTTDVLNKTNQLLAVHEERMDFLQSIDKDMEKKLERTLEEIKSIAVKMESMNMYLIGELTNTDVKIREELKSLNKSLDEDQDKQEARIKKVEDEVKKLERWKWIVIGFSIAATWIIDKIPFAVGIGS